MTYTAEQLRGYANSAGSVWYAPILLAFADALEENARLKAAWDASHKQAMKNGAACNEWRDRAERAEAELAETRRDLQFIERWANHHGQKPNITPREVLSMIQHYPPILEITRSYEDGKVPDTPNPWAELAKLRAEANDDDALRERMADILTRTAAALKGEPEPLTLHDWSGLPEIAELALTAERERAEAMERYKAFVDWMSLYGATISVVADERGSLRLDWYRGTAFGNSMDELMQALDEKIAAYRADFPEEDA